MITKEERVTLVLGQDRIEAIREDLISKSNYFASLFSSNFRDSLSDEYRINYDIDTNTLRTFVSWASECMTTAGGNCQIKPSLMRYVESSTDFDNLLRLLQLSVLFAAEALVKDLTDLIACHWLIPEKSLQLWLLAKELNLTMLMNLAQTTCMERLGDVPESQLLELSGEEFISLLGNVHAQAHPDLLLRLVLQWKLKNIPSDGTNTNTFDSRYPFTLSAKHLSQTEYRKKFEEQRWKNNIQCVVGHKLAKDNAEKACVYSWNGTTFSELVEIRSSMTPSAKKIVGRQVVGRGFDIYLVGGEYGLGTGRFEKEIWRYSTISRTWYYVTSLREPRRHMAVAFLREKLFVIGGVGRHRLKLSTVEVYDIYTGEWSKAANVPEEFTSTPPIFQVDGNLAIYKSALYIHDQKSDSWTTSCGQFCGLPSNQGMLQSETISVQFLMVIDGCVYIVDSEDTSYSRIWMVEILSDRRALHVGDCATLFNNQVANGPHLIGFSFKDGTVFVEVIKLGSPKLLKTLLVHSEKNSDVQDLCLNASIGCFNIFDPNTLSEQFNVLEL